MNARDYNRPPARSSQNIFLVSALPFPFANGMLKCCMEPYSHGSPVPPRQPRSPGRFRYRTIEEVVPRNWQENMILANGIRQHFYRTGGAKPPVVLLHGFQTSGLYWLRLAQALQTDYDLILLDGRGHGRSDGPETGYSLEILATDIAALIDALDLKLPALLGHSNGASVAVRFAADFPEIPRCLILEDPPMSGFDTARFQSEEAKAWQRRWFAWMQSLPAMSMEERIASMVNTWPPGWEKEWSEDELVCAADALTCLNLEVPRLGFVIPPTLADPGVLDGVICPILLLTGNPARGGALQLPRLASIAVRNNVEHVAFEDAGHFISRSQPQRFTTLVREFLAKHDPA